MASRRHTRWRGPHDAKRVATLDSREDVLRQIGPAGGGMRSRCAQYEMHVERPKHLIESSRPHAGSAKKGKMEPAQKDGGGRAQG